MSKKVHKYVPKIFESDNELLPKRKNGNNATDVSANIYGSMILSDAWGELNLRQMKLYIACKHQYYAEKKNPADLITVIEKEENKTPDLTQRFTMNKSKWCDIYKIYPSSASSVFYKDIVILENLGFIDILQRGGESRIKNIYQLSSRWRDYKKH